LLIATIALKPKLALSLYRFIALSLYRFIALSLYRFIALPLYRFTALPLYRLFMLVREISKNVFILKKQREELLSQIALRENQGSAADDLKATLLETQAAIFDLEPEIPFRRRLIE
jgi:hypothetical protein